MRILFQREPSQGGFLHLASWNVGAPKGNPKWSMDIWYPPQKASAPKTRARPQPLATSPALKLDDSSASSCTIQRFFFTRWIEASLLYSKVAPADLVEDALKAAPPCSKVALADSVENPLETSPLCSKVCMAESSEHLDEAAPHATNSKAMRRFGRGKECTSFFRINPRKRVLAAHFLKI